jgi:type I restriction enzyme S subunit
VGIIPQDWGLAALGDLTEKVGSGITPTGGQRVYRSDGRPFVRSQNVGWGRLLLEDIAFIDESTHSTFADTEIHVGDVLLNITGASIGRSALADSRLVGGNVNQHVCIIRTDDRKLIPQLLNMFLLSGAGQRQIDSFQAGGNRQGLNFRQVRSIRVPLPPTEVEQRAIATALSDVDALLGSLDELIVKKRDLKQAVMQELLTGQTRLPGFLGHWELKTLNEVCQKIQDGTHYSPKLGGNDYLYVTSKNIRFGRLDMSTAERISSAEHAKIYARCDVRKGDLLLTKDGANTGNAALNVLDEPISLLSSVAMLRFDGRYHIPAYIMYQVLSNDGQAQIKEAMSGNAITRLTLQKIRKLKFLVAPYLEQAAISDVLLEIDAELSELETRRDKTRALRQGMMQELLTGKTRLVPVRGADV